MTKHTQSLKFIQSRLVNVLGENPNMDYMHALERAVEYVESTESPVEPVTGYVVMEVRGDADRARLFLEHPTSLYVFTSGELKDNLEENLVQVTRLAQVASGNQLYVKKKLTWLEHVTKEYGFLEYDESGGMHFSRKQMSNFVGLCHLVASVTNKPEELY